jgi:uncharacterized FlaG/YvyC family protein
MTKEEIEDLSEKIKEGLRLAEIRMYKEKALRGEYVVIADEDGVIRRIPAQQVIDEHPEDFKE